MVRQYRTISNKHRTSSNLLAPHHFLDSKMWTVHYHEFGVVRTSACMHPATLECSSILPQEEYAMGAQMVSTSPSSVVNTFLGVFPVAEL